MTKKKAETKRRRLNRSTFKRRKKIGNLRPFLRQHTTLLKREASWLAKEITQGRNPRLALLPPNSVLHQIDDKVPFPLYVVYLSIGSRRETTISAMRLLRLITAVLERRAR